MNLYSGFGIIWSTVICSSCALVIKINNSTGPLYEHVENHLETPQWYAEDLYDISSDPKIRNLIRYPPPERQRGFTYFNQEPRVLSSKDHQLLPSASKLLQIEKAPLRVFTRSDYQPVISTGLNARHKFAEGIHIRWRHIGVSDEPLIAALYMPVGWPLMLGVAFFLATMLVPIIGAFLVQTGFMIARYFQLLLWEPLKGLLRSWLIRRQISAKWWEKYIAPPQFLEPRVTWKLPYFLRNDKLEDIPPELAYKPPINRIDYTMYILTEEDYDEMDLGMDEMELVDDLLQFRDTSPKLVARLLRFHLGDEKFYYYFDEDVLSDESEEDIAEPVKQPENVEDVKVFDLAQKQRLLDVDESWMHDEFDKTFTGPAHLLEEIRDRRQMIHKIKQEIAYLTPLLTKESMVDKTYKTEEQRKKGRQKAVKLMDKYLRYSKMTKQRIAEIEPTTQVQTRHNVALSKYLPLIDQMSHYNHRLNLKHEKQQDPKKRKTQLEIFGGP